MVNRKSIEEPFEIWEEKCAEPPKPPVLNHGKWILKDKGSAWCPRCHFRALDDIFSAVPLISNFCPDCGMQLMFTDKPIMGRSFAEVEKEIRNSSN